jgi:hypothetical protein
MENFKRLLSKFAWSSYSKFWQNYWLERNFIKLRILRLSAQVEAGAC